MTESKRTTQSKAAHFLDDLVRLCRLNRGVLVFFRMDYFTSRDEGPDDDVTKDEESDDYSLKYEHVLAFLTTR